MIPVFWNVDLGLLYFLRGKDVRRLTRILPYWTWRCERKYKIVKYKHEPKFNIKRFEFRVITDWLILSFQHYNMKNIYCNQNIFDSIFSSRLTWTKEENIKMITWISFTALSKSTKVTTQFNAFEFKFVFVENQFYSKAKYSFVDLSLINLFQKNHTQSLRTSLFYIYFFFKRRKPETLQKYLHL